MENILNNSKVRYDRQIRISEIGFTGQKKLKKAKVVITGIGGLGSIVSLYLTSAGVGNIKIIDHGYVELSNLNRQVLYYEEDIGKSKVESAVKKLKKLNSKIEIKGIQAKIDKLNALKLIEKSDVAIDCLDNFRTRFILNETAIKLKIPFIHGACFGFEGRVTTIIPFQTPCLNCIFSTCPTDEIIPIIGTTAGVIGAIQATEVIKFLTGTDPLLTNKLLIYDGKNLTYDLIDIQKNRECSFCGKNLYN